MAEITQVITAMTEAPQTTDGEVAFTTKADPFLAGIEGMPPEYNAFGSQANSLRTDVLAAQTAAETAETNAETAKSIAQATANFTGNWDDLTGAAAIPYSCYHDHKYWQLLTGLADVTSKEPGATGSETTWVEVGSVVFYERKTANFTAESNKSYKCNAGLTITLPASPTNNDRLSFSPLQNMEDSNCTINRNSKKIMGLSENMTWNVNTAFGLIYDSTNGDWRVAI